MAQQNINGVRCSHCKNPAAVLSKQCHVAKDFFFASSIVARIVLRAFARSLMCVRVYVCGKVGAFSFCLFSGWQELVSVLMLFLNGRF